MVSHIGNRLENAGVPPGPVRHLDDVRLVVEKQRPFGLSNRKAGVDGLKKRCRVLRMAKAGAVEDIREEILQRELVLEIVGTIVVLTRRQIKHDVVVD